MRLLTLSVAAFAAGLVGLVSTACNSNPVVSGQDSGTGMGLDAASRAEGTEGGPCFANGTCMAGLSCFSSLCVNANVSPDAAAGLDAAEPAPDAGAGPPDAALPITDAATAGLDAARPSEDASARDSGASPPDAGPSDPCTIDNGGCDMNANCDGTSGSPTCTCNSGYAGDGITCATKALTTLATGQTGAHSIAVRDGYVYFSTANGGLSKVPTSGGTPTPLGTVAEPASGDVRDIAVDGSSVFAASFFTAGTGYPLSSVLIGGGSVATLGVADGLGVAVDANNVYWTNYMVGAVYQLARSGSSPKTLASGSRPLGIAVDSSYVYWGDAASKTINRVPIGGTSNAVLATVASAAYLQYIAIDSSDVYFIDEGNGTDGSLMRVSLTGGSVTPLASTLNHPAFLALDAAYAYLTFATAGTVVAYSKTNGVPTTVATGQSSPKHIAVDSYFVYWTNTGDGTLMRVSRL